MLEKIVGKIVVGSFWLMLGSAGFAGVIALDEAMEKRCAGGEVKVITWGRGKDGSPQRGGEVCMAAHEPDQVWARNEKGRPVRVR